MKKITRVNESAHGRFEVWHGTDAEFTRFDSSKIGSGNRSAWNGIGFYFSDSKAEASLYGKILMRCEIYLANPYDMRAIKDTSCVGSGVARALASLGLYDRTIIARLNSVESKYERRLVQVSDSGGPGGKFYNVWMEYDDKEYVTRNRTEAEIEDDKNIRSMYVNRILNDVYKITLPQRISDVCGAYEFTAALKRNGYDGVIAHNSTVPSGNEYVVFDPEAIRILR